MLPVPWYKNKNTIIKLLLILAGFLWSLYIFFPGSYSIDTWAQYDEMVHNRYDDWHSPMLPLLWRLLYLCTGAYYSIFIFQMVWFWIFIYLLLVQINKNDIVFGLGMLFVVFFLFIPQYVMKDSHFALACGTAGVLVAADMYAGTASHRITKWIGILCLVYAAFLRMNCIVSILPLLLLYVAFYFTKRKSFFFNLSVAAGICILIAAGYYITTYKILKANRVYPEYKLELLDVVGITKLSGQNYVPPCISGYKDYNQAQVLQQYTSATFDDIYWPKHGTAPMIQQPTKELNTCVTQSWKQAIIDHPILYLKNRGEGFLYYLRIKKRFKNSEYHNIGIWTEPDNPFHLVTTDNSFIRTMDRLYAKLALFYLFDPWLWSLSNVVLCIYFFARYKRDKIAFYLVQAAIQLSGVLFTLSQFPVYQHDRDFRYNYWNVFVFFIGMAMILVLPRRTSSRAL